MDWITDLLKHLAISKSVIAAIFVTAVVMVVGHQLYPSIVPLVPEPWGAALFAAMILTGTLLLFWGASVLWSIVSSLFHSTRASGKLPKLNESHYSLLLLLGQNPLESLDIDRFNFQEVQVSKLEVIQWAEELERNDLVSINPFHRSFITLTAKGRVMALKIEKQHA